MSDKPQAEAYDTISTLTMKVGGADVRSSLQRIFLALRNGFQRGGNDAIVVVTITTHVPQRRLPEVNA